LKVEVKFGVNGIYGVINNIHNVTFETITGRSCIALTPEIIKAVMNVETNIKKTGYLSGIAETSNASQGHLNHKGNVLEIVYVGDEDKAKQIELAEKSVGNAKAIVQDIKSLTANIGVWQMKEKHLRATRISKREEKGTGREQAGIEKGLYYQRQFKRFRYVI